MAPNRDTDRPEVDDYWERSGESLADRDLVLRSGGLEDVDAILDIEQQAHPTPWSREIFERELALDWSHLWLVVEPGEGGDEEGDETVAFLIFWTVHDEIHILNVAVTPSRRRQGIATDLIAALVTAGRQRAYAFITLEVRETNTAAIELYRQMGFETMGEREEYYADTGEAALLMQCML